MIKALVIWHRSYPDAILKDYVDFFMTYDFLRYTVWCDKHHINPNQIGFPDLAMYLRYTKGYAYAEPTDERMAQIVLLDWDVVNEESTALNKTLLEKGVFEDHTIAKTEEQ